MKKKLFSVFLVLLLVLPAVYGCKPVEDTTDADGSALPNSSAEASSAPEPVKEPVSIRLTAAGDNLIHNGIYNQAQERAGGNGYDFTYAYKNAAKLIDGDINILNQETLLASAVFPPSNYPLFCTPTEVGDEMLKIGFNVFTLANNHMLDKGTKGMNASLDYWEAHADENGGILTSGCYRNQAELEQVRTMTKNDIRVGFVSATEQTNGLKLPASSEMKILYTADEEQLEKQIRATGAESDFVVVAVHWGTENSMTVNSRQKELAKKMAGWGADLIIGTHPHVLQDMEWITRTNGEKTLAAYSLGNFISAMKPGACMLGGVLDIELTKDYAAQKTTITQAKLNPIVTHFERGWRNITVYPLADYTEELALRHGVRFFSSGATKGFGLTYLNRIVTQKIDAEFLSAPEKE